MRPEHFDAASAAASKTTIGGAIVAAAGLLSLNEALAARSAVDLGVA